MKSDIRVMTSGAFTAAYRALIPQLELLSGRKMATLTTSIGTGENSIPNRLKRGEVADLVIVAGAPEDSEQAPSLADTARIRWRIDDDQVEPIKFAGVPED